MVAFESHPYGIKPWGNYLSDASGGAEGGLGVRRRGLGPLLGVLSDHHVLEVMGALGAEDLSRLSRCSRALYAFAHHPDLWKALTLTRLGADKGCGTEGPCLTYHPNGWKETFLRTFATSTDSEAPLRHRPLRVAGLYSDVLHEPHALSGWGPRPAWLARDNCPRVHRPSIKEFRRDYEEPNVPVLITGVVEHWPAFHKWRTHQGFQDAAGGPQARFHGGGLSFSLEGYWAYARHQRDDLPLYIFDSRFAEKSPGLAADYHEHIPPYFQEDLFGVLGGGRPDHRWLIMGPKRSGSSFHKDPNSTAAWNAVLRGSKKWILLPPHVTPPGVHPTQDGLDLATPVTLAEWFQNFYREASALRPAPVECVARAGDLMFVPRGWWHLVLNLEDSVAITQNYVSSVGLPHVLEFLDERRHLISGLPEAARAGLYERFVAALGERHPDLLAQAQAKRAAGRGSTRRKRPLFGGEPDESVNGTSNAKAFKFGFSFSE